jgi:hypothetical protein
MKTSTVLTEFESRAADTLRALIARFSAIKLIELKHESRGGFAAILARISIYGHIHTLTCAADPMVEPARLRAMLRQVQESNGPLAADAIPLVIAPCLSPEAQAICKQNKIGFLDFEGNARLTVGDFFIVMRSLPRAGVARVSASPDKRPARVAIDPIFPDVLPNFPQKQVERVGVVAVPA